MLVYQSVIQMKMGDIHMKIWENPMKTIYKWENHRTKFNGHDSGID